MNDGANWGPTPFGPFLPVAGTQLYPGPGGFTAAFWFRAEPGIYGVFRDYYQHNACGEIWELYYRSDLPQSGPKIGFAVHGTCSEPEFQLDGPLPLGQWVHLAGVWEPQGNLAKIYVNGVLKGQIALHAPMRGDLPPNVFLSGSWHGTNPATIDDARLYNTALSAAQIARLAGADVGARVTLAKAIKLTADVLIGARYQLRVSTDLKDWTPAADPFVAVSDPWTDYVDVDWSAARYFRLVVVP
jgi:hypothetical protein